MAPRWRAETAGRKVAVLGLGLRQVQEALNKKADEIQHEFVAISDELEAVSRKLLEVSSDDRPPLRAEQESLRAKQAELADEVNLWRERARAVTQQRGETGLRAYMEELKGLGDPVVTYSAQQALESLDAPEDALARMQAEQDSSSLTPATRLLQRARKEYDLRGSDAAPRQRAAVEFANRRGMAQDDKALEEMEAGMSDGDPQVREVAFLACVQIYRFRALRLAELDNAHEAVLKLAALDHRAAVSPLIEVVSVSRSGYVNGPAGLVEGDNSKSRMVAMLRLVEWHTPDAHRAIQQLRFDRDSHMVKAAEKSLQLFPGEWKGPLKASDQNSGQW
jgi:hypothetical protein